MFKVFDTRHIQTIMKTSDATFVYLS